MKIVRFIFVVWFVLLSGRGYAEDPKFISTPKTTANVLEPYFYEIVAVDSDIISDGKLGVASSLMGSALSYSTSIFPSWLMLSEPIVEVWADFEQPVGLVADDTGNIYVADKANHCVKKITPKGTTTIVAGICGTSGSAEAQVDIAQATFNNPSDIALDSKGYIYIADTGNRSIRQIADDQVTVLAGAESLNSPVGIAVDTQDNIYVADIGNHSVFKITPDEIISFGSGKQGLANGSYDFAKFNTPYDVVVDKLGNIYVADKVNNCIRLVTLEDSISTLAGKCVLEQGIAGFSDGVADVYFYIPVSLVMDAMNNIYVADQGNRLIRKISPTGIVTTLAGSTEEGNMGGLGVDARFGELSGITIDKMGNIYVADQLNHRIYSITPPRVTLTGTPSIKDVGTHKITLRACDSSQQCAEQSFTLTVTAPPPAPDFSSIPAPNIPLDFGASSVGVPMTQTLILRKTGAAALWVDFRAITGEHADDFSFIEPDFPITIPDQGFQVVAQIQCTPSDTGLRTATLTLSTNVVGNSIVTYPLSCLGKMPPGYASEPPDGSTLFIGMSPVGASISQTFSVKETGGTDLVVDMVSITGPDAEDFAVILPALPFTIAEGGDPQIVRIKCQHFDSGAVHTATLKLSTNDPNNPFPTYQLECLGRGPVYASRPAPEQTIDLGHTTLGTSTQATLEIAATGGGHVVVNLATLEGPQKADFQIISPSFPLTLQENKTPTAIHIACTPTTTGRHTANLVLTTNDIENPTVHYPLVCTGEIAPVAGYASAPPPGSTLDLGETFIDMPVTQTLTVSEIGELELEVAIKTLNGPAAKDFEILSLPLTINEGESPKNIKIQCTPSQVGLRTARLTLATNDTSEPGHSAPFYDLTCTGNAQIEEDAVHQVIYTSIPTVGSTLQMQSSLGKPTTTVLTISTQHDLALDIDTSVITGADSQNFEIIAGAAPFTVSLNEAPHSLTIQCVPETAGLHKAQLRLTTNAVEQPIADYTLACLGEPVAFEAHFAGEIRSQTSAGPALTLDAPEYFSLIGYIQPDSQHIGQTATLTAIYHWQPIGEDTVLNIPVVIARKKLLAPLMELTLFQGRLAGSPGTVTVDLAYQVDQTFLAQPIATLTVLPNRAPVDIALSANTIAEDSPIDTVVGTLRGIDPDNSEWFVYGLTDNAGGRFKIVQDELCVAGQLDFEQDPKITVRAVDTNGQYIDKEFVIHITDISDILTFHLTHHQIPEQSASGTVVGQFLANADHNATYELLDDAQGRFTLVQDKLLVAKGQLLDFETQTHHSIKVRSQNTKTSMEQVFDIEVTNMIDVAIKKQQLLNQQKQPITAHRIKSVDQVTVQLNLIPDATHVGQGVELVSILIHTSQDGEHIMAKALGKTAAWQDWSGNLATLPAAQSRTLSATQAITLWQGRLPTGTAQIFVGYRAKTQAVFYATDFIAIQID